MNKYNKTSLVALSMAAAISFAPNALAHSIWGNDITINDNKNTSHSWEGGTGSGTREDNETEPGTTHSQAWDLEGIFLNNNTLTLVGGYNFFNTNSGDWRPGDIFFNTVGAITDAGGAGAGNNTVLNRFGYEYALDVNWANLTFDVIQLDDTSSKTITVNYNINARDFPGPGPGSNPWRYSSGGLKLTTEELKNLGVFSDASSGFSDDNSNSNDFNHYAVSFDLTNFFSLAGLNGKEFDIHFTMGCGNDNLMGHGTAPAPVPEPATMLLFGTSLALIGGRIRRKRS